MKRITRRERIKAMAKLWQTYPDAKFGWCSSEFNKSGYLLAGTVTLGNSNDSCYIWLDSNLNIVKTGKEINGCIEGYP